MLAVVESLLAIPDLPLRLGFMIATAMILGVIMDPEWRGFGKWLVVLVVFIICQSWIHTSVSTESHKMLDETVVSLIISLLFFGGMAIGVLVVHVAKKPYKVYRQELEKRLKEIEDSNYNKKDW